MRPLLLTVVLSVAVARCAAMLAFGSRARRDRDEPEGAMWREFGLRNALANMPHDSPGRAVIEALLARETEATPAQPSPATPASGANVLEQLERLVSLRERGYLTDQDFEAAKRKLLD